MRRRLLADMATGWPAMAVNHKTTSYHFNLGLALQAQGKLREAVAEYQHALKLKPGFAEALSNLGGVLREQGRLEEARARLEQALVLKPDFAEARSNLGEVLRDQGKLDEAVAEYRRALLLRPDFDEALNNLGGVLREQGELEEARARLERALVLRPDFAEALNNLGGVFHEQGKLGEAVAAYKRALALKPEFAEAFNNLGLALQTQNKQSEAVSAYQRALLVRPDFVEALNNLGAVLREQGELEEAVVQLERALTLRPDYAEALSNLGGVLREQGKLEESKARLERALMLKPNFAGALNNLGAVHKEDGALEDARACLERALALKPDFAEALNTMGAVLKEQGALREARVCLERALVLKPDFADAHCNLGSVFQANGKPKSALIRYEQAVALKPDSATFQWNRALVQLLQGDFRAGWHNYEWRRERKEGTPRSFSQPQWRGEPLKGARILLHAEQGLGDTLQFLRYQPMVVAAGGTVLLDVPASLRRLAAQLPGITSLTVSGEALPPFDWHCPLMSLPLALRTTLETIPGQVPYLRIPEEAQKVADALSWPNHGLRVGLVWAGSPKHKNDRRRSLSLSLLAPLFAIEGVHLFSLQMGPASAQLATAPAAITDLAFAIGDMADTAALIAHLDLVITVDTSVAHLAGALAKPTWVLLPFAPEWRWLLEREDSPWYPATRLFRQPELGDWHSVIARVGADLVALSGGERMVRKPLLPQADFDLHAKRDVPASHSMAGLAQIADARDVSCKICAGLSSLFGVVDFHKSCIEAQGRRLPLSGYAVYYRRCQQCGFAFTTAFDSWDANSFHEYIYNDDYIIVDPDFADARPSGNARLVASSFSGYRDAVEILDFGGGEGRFAARLREQGFSAATYDPFSSFDQLPANKFDLVTCFEVLEHVPVPQDTVATMVSVLKNPGAILFSTLVQPADFAAVGLKWWYASPRNGHISLYSTQSLARLFKPHGMRVGSFNANLHIAYAEVPPFAAHLQLPG